VGPMIAWATFPQNMISPSPFSNDGREEHQLLRNFELGHAIKSFDTWKVCRNTCNITKMMN
jgi:hypothetical protein